MGRPKKIKSANASVGLNLMFIAELLAIVSVIFSIITIIIVGGKATTEVSEAVVAIIGIFGIIVGVAAIVGFVLMLVGLAKAGQDKRGFKIAFWLTIASLIAQIVATFIAVVIPPIVTAIITIAVAVIQVIVAYLVITTAADLLEAKGKTNVADFGRKVWIIYAICLIASIILSIVSSFVALPTGTVLLIINLALSILEIVGYILFIIFLRKASVNLA